MAVVSTRPYFGHRKDGPGAPYSDNPVYQAQPARVNIGIMKARRTIALGIPFLLIAAFVLSAPDIVSQSTYSVRGQVIDVAGGWVPGASVRLYSAQRVLDLRADWDGKFEYKNVPTGIYELEGLAAGFNIGTVDFEIAEKSPEPFSIKLSPGQDSHFPVRWVKVSVSYEKRSGKVDMVGEVRDKSGSPVPAVKIKLAKGGTSQETRSNLSGDFTFSEVEPGKYSLQSSPAQQGYFAPPATVWITRENVINVVLTLIDMHPDTQPAKFQSPGLSDPTR